MLEIIGLVLIGIAILWLFGLMIVSKYNYNYPQKRKDKLDNFAIIIPARDEAKVIEQLLISIAGQTLKVEMKNVYVIVENKDDPTVQIAQKYGVSLFLRKHLELQSKGYALQELLEFLNQQNIFYNAYFIIDADNVLDRDFLMKMEETYKQGYDIGMGYRNLKNGNDSLIAAASGITFQIINARGNETKSKESRNITLSGTGLYISGDIVKNWQTFPFHSLTEDYELTLYSIENNLTSNYNKNAIFYDEQPVEYNKTINQRMRWIRGYFDNQRKYVPKFFKMLKNNPNYASLLTEITGMWPYILMIIGAILYILGQLGNIILGNDIRTAILKIFLVIIGAYTLFVGLVTYVILKDEDKINLSKAMQVKVTFFAPLFFVTYIPCALKALFKKEVKWEKTEHNRTLKQKID